MNQDPVQTHFSALAEQGVWASLYQPEAKVTAESYSYLVRARRVMELLGSRDGPPRSLLSIGCGTAPLGPAIVAMGARYTGMDFSPSMIDAACRRMGDFIAAGSARLLVGDARNVALPDAAFDAVLAIGLVEYVPHGQITHVMQEVARLLAPGGAAIVTIPKRWCWSKVLNAVSSPVRRTIAWRPPGAHLKLHRKEAFDRLYLTPAELDRIGRSAGLLKIAERHYNVQIVGGPFIFLGPRLAYLINRPFEWMARIPGLSFMATGYIAMYGREPK
jgi:ubiquinone/menaquinone biosynthesis C-methylase UbiE